MSQQKCTKWGETLFLSQLSCQKEKWSLYRYRPHCQLYTLTNGKNAMKVIGIAEAFPNVKC